MNRTWRVARVLLGLAALAGLALLLLLVFTVRRPFPTTDGALVVPGLREEVHVYRDGYGVPHIYAQNEHDLFFAQGYVHAQDRFWQMEFWRHVGQGRISEIAGEATVPQDTFIRTFGWNRIAQDIVDSYAATAPEFLTILEDYSAGVNAYIEANRNALAVQITILGQVQGAWEIEPWTPINSVSWGVLMSDNLSSDWDREIDRLRLLQSLGPDALAQLLPGYPYDDRPVIAPTDQQRNGLPSAAGPRSGGQEVAESTVNTRIVGAPLPDGLGLGRGPFVGSNNWVVSGEHTSSGLPLLANDPHLAVQMPSIWYEAGLHAPGWNVAGFSFAGVPGIIVGHNDHIAWGVTTSAPDVQDLYIEELNPENPRQYRVEDGWEEMDVIEEVIRVNGGEDVVMPVFITRHGPIITDLIASADDPQAPTDALSVRWSAQEPSRILQAVVLLNLAQDYEEFFEALRYWDTPSQNIVYADVAGNIGYVMPGRVPIRRQGEGTLPMPGWTGEYEWTGWIPHDSLPSLFNPEGGVIVTANNAVVDADYPYLLTGYMGNDGNRAQRIVDLIEAVLADRGQITADDFARIQFDALSLAAADYVPLLAGLRSDDDRVQAALDKLQAWDRQEDPDSVGATLFELFFMHLSRSVLVDDVGEENLTRAANLIFMHELADQPEASWWDDQNTAVVESQQEMLLRAVADAVTWLTDNMGREMSRWTWGELHTITFADAVLGQSGIAPIEALFNRGPYPVGGGASIVNANSWRWADVATVHWHPSMRLIVDMSDLNASRAVHPTGQSGHPFHPHYDDMIPLWLTGEYHPMPWGRDQVEAAASDHLILRP